MTIRLTETVTKGGCAAKLPAGQLRQVLAGLKLPHAAELVVGTDTLDDACLWDLGNGTYLTQTVDFFTPIVDDPYDFGAIAAANAISDVYAMGGTPKLALTVLGFPVADLPLELLQPLMQGAIDKIAEAGCVLAGGHTIDDSTLKLGFCVTGFVEKAHTWTNAGAKPGDVLILTKALGTGTITSALKNKKAQPNWVESAVKSMTQLNRVPELLPKDLVHSATDITGFGLAGHARQMAEASGVGMEILVSRLPSLIGAAECLQQGILNRAHHSNADYAQGKVEYGPMEDAHRWLTLDPQTSGGLLLSVPKASGLAVIEALRYHFPHAAVVGQVHESNASGRYVFFR